MISRNILWEGLSLKSSKPSTVINNSKLTNQARTDKIFGRYEVTWKCHLYFYGSLLCWCQPGSIPIWDMSSVLSLIIDQTITQYNNTDYFRYLLTTSSQLFSLQVLTKDSVTVSVDAVVYYRVSNATVSVANVENAHHSTRCSVRRMLCCSKLFMLDYLLKLPSEISWERKTSTRFWVIETVYLTPCRSVNHYRNPDQVYRKYLQTILDDATTAWGIKVERVEM